MREKLREAGLTENESKLYLTLLELGPSNAGLISRKSGLHRRVVYDTIEMLIQKGLIGYIKKNNVKLFQATNPERVMEIIKEKEEQVAEIMPTMLEMFNKTKEREETNFYKGKNGLKTVFEEQLSLGKEILIIGGSSLAYELFEFYFNWYDKIRIEKKIKTRIIFNRSKQKIKIPFSEVRYLPEKYSSPLAVNIYGDKVAIILWNREKPFAVVIQNKEIAAGYKNHFEIMWKAARAAEG